jgi:diguanylate cyclase
LLMLYQPKIHVRRQEINSAEALVRWRHPERGMVLPNDFIPAAEQGQIIDRMTLWTIARVIRDQRTLRAAGHDLRIFINISGQLLADAAFVRAACDLVAESDATLGFEVTETSVIRDPSSAIANLQRFADIGVTIAIDDYGAGLSSLAYLKQLPARELKIDKLFITQLTSSNRDPLIVRSTIDLAHALEMEVVAEGVETHAALALLTVMGCDMVQGFLISRPIALEALIVFLRDDSHHQTPQDSRASFSRLATVWKRA